MSMNGMVNSTLRDRVKRAHSDVNTYRTANGIPNDATLEDIAILASEQAVQGVVGYLLMDLVRLNERLDSLALSKLIDHHAKSVRLTVGPNYFSTALTEGASA